MLVDTPNLIQWTDPADAAFTVLSVAKDTNHTTIDSFGTAIKLLKPLDLSVWLTAQRPALDAGGHVIGFASDTGQLELWDGAKWSQVPTLLSGVLSGVAGAFTGLSASTSFTVPSLASTTTGVATVSYNTGTGRFDFGLGGSVVNHVRLSGDTMTGALTLPGLTNTSTLAQQGDITLGTGSGTARLTSGTTGNVVIGLKGASSLLSFTSGNTGAPTLLQLSSSANSITSKYQLVVQAQGGGTPVWSGAIINAMAPIYSSLTWTGTSTVSGGFAVLGRYASITSQVTNSGGSNGVAVDQLTLILNSANVTGVAHVISATMNMTATTGNLLANGGTDYSAANFTAQASANDNGTGLTVGTSHGALFASNPVAQLLTGATNWSGITATEFDVGVQAGASVMNKSGASIITLASDAVQGAIDDYALFFASQANTTPGWRKLISVGNNGGFSPMDPTNGWVLGFSPHLASGTIGGAGGLDFTNFVPTTAFMRGNNFLIDPSGNITGNIFKVGANQVLGARITGWGAASNGAKAAFNGSTATLAQTSAAVAQLIADLTTHGLIGA